MTPAAILDLIAVFIFALTGGLVASRAQLDIVGFLFLACLTGVGGGTLRDLVLGRDPVFWVGSPHYLAVACAAAILAFFTAHRLESRYQVIVWLDALLAADVGAEVLVLVLGQHVDHAAEAATATTAAQSPGWTRPGKRNSNAHRGGRTGRRGAEPAVPRNRHGALEFVHTLVCARFLI